MTGRPDPQTCGWSALVFLGAAVSVACFTVAGRAALELWRGRSR